jgi:hypothetical protein
MELPRVMVDAESPTVIEEAGRKLATKLWCEFIATVIGFEVPALVPSNVQWSKLYELDEGVAEIEVIDPTFSQYVPTAGLVEPSPAGLREIVSWNCCWNVAV